MGLFNFLEKKYSGWALEADGEEQGEFTIKDIENHLNRIGRGEEEFIILTPSLPLKTSRIGRVCNFVQTCQDKNLDYFHLEIGTARAGQEDEILIYGKDGLTGEELLETIKKILSNNAIPDIEDWEIVLDMRTEVDKETYNEIVGLLTDNQTVISKLARCFDSPNTYFDENAERYDERCIEADEEKDKIIWIAIVDELIESGDVIELDWKEGFEEFIAQMKNLADNNNLDLQENRLNKGVNIPAWCEILDEEWNSQGFCVGAMDIDSDSFVMFVCRRETLEKLMALGKKVNQRFDFAKNM